MDGRRSDRSGLKAFGIGLVIIAVVAVLGTIEFLRTRPVRESMGTLYRLIAAANRQDLEALQELCTGRYLASHPLRPAPEGGMIGIPGLIAPNFQAWREGDTVLVCTASRVGPVFRLARERGEWKFDGPAGYLDRSGRVVPGLSDEGPATVGVVTAPGSD